ncbi:MAG: peptidoglycan-binding domain-containing protein [Eubacteriales bacterium]|nr:peptidoglycan-binding domain-containing protein [Eubacteriales bacterium]
MPLTRTLRYGSAGEDVMRVKQRLLALNCYDARVTQLRSSTFGRDTLKAVFAFQARIGLTADGVVGPLTYAALFPEEMPERIPVERASIPAQIGDSAAAAILQSLDGASKIRKSIVLDALTFAYDATQTREYPTSLYIRGGNLYNTDLTPNVISLSRIASGARRQPEFYDGGRREMMERAVEENPAITGADCSGGVVGLLRHAGVVKPKFDLSADGFASSGSTRTIAQEELLSADLLHKSGHIGLYAGGGFAVEWMGGAYGCQITKLTRRRGWNFVKHTTDRFGAWTSFLRPSWY